MAVSSKTCAQTTSRRSCSKRSASVHTSTRRVEDVHPGVANQAGETTGTSRAWLCPGGFRGGARPDRQPALRFRHAGDDRRGSEIQVGAADIVIAGGVESMTRAPWVMPKPTAHIARSTNRLTTPHWGGGWSTRDGGALRNSADGETQRVTERGVRGRRHVASEGPARVAAQEISVSAKSRSVTATTLAALSST